jgi:hypothetical protein
MDTNREVSLFSKYVIGIRSQSKPRVNIFLKNTRFTNVNVLRLLLLLRPHLNTTAFKLSLCLLKLERSRFGAVRIVLTSLPKRKSNLLAYKLSLYLCFTTIQKQQTVGLLAVLESLLPQ